MTISTQSHDRPQSRRRGRPSSATRKCRSKWPLIRVCFFDQNPLSLAQLGPLLPHSEFQVVSENEIRPADSPSTQGPLILVMDEKHLRPEHQPFLQMLRRRFREAKFLVLGEKPPEREHCEVLRCMHGFVPYSQATQHLAPALRALSNGHFWLPHVAYEYFAQLAANSTGTQMTAPFTQREMEILLLLTDKLSNKEIAGKLHITERTVKYHLVKTFDKLGTHDRHSASEMAISWRALEPHLAAA